MTPDSFMIWRPVKTKGKSVLGKVFGEIKYRKMDVPYLIEWGKTMPSEAEMKEINELRDLLDDTKAFSERFETYRDFAGDISLLVLKVEMGEPLEGTCSLCPKVKIIEKKEGVKP